ncbi:octanoyltransferase [Sphingomonas sp. Leaf407]|uniref:lipoyl(octanoyl) transferase LipB n=1 Tax=unclassified Sphingomonas TaxID=196159 RepID=UPI0006F614C3|nr:MULTISPECIES: lipoyl(octanoyl) transferase LipB [unclassified Sphingomonas]KQN37193.1 octanoyltransferase [Sphingomonas sp. Leaf42]KQT30841.1 octanoyltransferase [Sphingomonas sp. Leaf407]
MATDPPSPPPQSPPAAIEWRVAPRPVEYPDALATMEARATAIADGQAGELIWLLEHPALYTAGTSADPAELLDPRFPVHAAGRGGRYTYHGPGQRIGYLMLDLTRHGRDVRRFVHAVEDWVIGALRTFDIHAYAVPDRIGIWTADGGTEAKIGAIGVRVRRWATLHGFSVNLSPDLSHFGGIVPCGIAEFPVTSATALGKPVTPGAFDAALAQGFADFLDRLSTVAKNEA